MRIEILGISPVNKGALLMLEAVRQQLDHRIGPYRLAVSLDFPAADRTANMVSGCIRYERPRSALRIGTRLPKLWRYAPRAMRGRGGFVRPEEIDVILDASGFAYGDYWGASKARRRILDRIGSWKTSRNVAIMLPQALGPFTDPDLRDTMIQGLPLYDRVHVRDQRSYSFVEDLGISMSQVSLSPDFTNAIKPPAPIDRAMRGLSLIIPNAKLVQDKPRLRPHYYRTLRAAVEEMQRQGDQVSFLIHEGFDDLKIAQEANGELAVPIPIINELSVLEIKSVISAAKIVVSSRFHGLVSALSSGVPCLALGWSHKYGELMRDYSCGDFSLDFRETDSVRSGIQDLYVAIGGNDLKSRILTAGKAQEAKTDQLWSSSIKLIESVVEGS